MLRRFPTFVLWLVPFVALLSTACTNPCRQLCEEWLDYQELVCPDTTVTIEERSRCLEDHRRPLDPGESDQCSFGLQDLLEIQKLSSPNHQACCALPATLSCRQCVDDISVCEPYLPL